MYPVLFDPPDNPERKEKPDSTLKNKIIIEIVIVIIIAGCGGTGCNHTLGRLRQEDYFEFKVSLDCLVNLVFTNQNKANK